jgi:hypothetical protein
VIAALVGLVFFGSLARLVAITLAPEIVASIMTAPRASGLVVPSRYRSDRLAALARRHCGRAGADAIGRRQVIERGRPRRARRDEPVVGGALVGRHEFTVEGGVRIPGLGRRLRSRRSRHPRGMLVGENRSRRASTTRADEGAISSS